MTIERTHHGAWRIYTLLNGYLIQRTYFGYSKREAMAQFRADIKEGA